MWQQQCWGDTRYPHHEQPVCTATCQAPRCSHLQMPNQHLPSTQTPECFQQAAVIPPCWVSSTHPWPQLGWTLQAPGLCPFSGSTDKARAEQQVKGGTIRLHQGCGERVGSQERQKKWPSPASRVELAIARQFHKNAHWWDFIHNQECMLTRPGFQGTSSKQQGLNSPFST